MYSSVKSINITYLILELVLDLPRARASNRPGSFPPAIKQLLTYMSRYGIPTEQINDIILKSFNKQHGVLQVPFPQFMPLPSPHLSSPSPTSIKYQHYQHHNHNKSNPKVPEILAIYTKFKMLAFRNINLNLEDWFNEIYTFTVQHLGKLYLLQQVNRILTINTSELGRFYSTI